ncbi:MAG: response regulator [Acidobacteriota bacterium]
MKEKKEKKDVSTRNSIKPEKTTEKNLSFHHQESEKIINQLNNEIKKNLWGVEQDRLKIRKLVELAVEKLNKIHELKKIEKKLFSSSQSEEQAKVFAKYFDFIEQEIRKFNDILNTLTSLTDEKILPPPEIEGKEKTAAPPRKEIPSLKKPRKKPKILVVEDETIIVKSVSYFLISAGYEVIFTLNSQDGLKKAIQEKPDLIILDIIMPGMNGYQVLSLIKKNEHISHIPVIILSALSREADILEGLEKGATDYLTKPFSPEILVSKVKKALSEKDGYSSSHSSL